MSERLRLGVLGLGFAGATMLEVALRHEAIEVVAVADPDPELRRLTRDSVPRAYAGLDELLVADDVDGVYVATPTELHVAHAGALLEAGKHVVVEKPVATDLAGAASLVRLAGESGRAMVVGHSLSFEPFVRMVPLLASQYGYGALRRLVVQEENDWMRRPRLPAELDEQRGGGPVFRQGAHLIDVARFLTGGGEVRELTAAGVRGRPEEPCGSFVADFTAGAEPVAVRCTLAFNGWGAAASASPVTAPALPVESSRKRARNRAVLSDALNGTLAPKLAAVADEPGRRVLVAVYEHGYVGVRGRMISTREGVVDPDTYLSSGRHAVLDELVQAAGGGVALHDGTWGLDNLRVTLDVLDRIKAEAAAPGPLPPPFPAPTKEM